MAASVYQVMRKSTQSFASGLVPVRFPAGGTAIAVSLDIQSRHIAETNTTIDVASIFRTPATQSIRIGDVLEGTEASYTVSEVVWMRRRIELHLATLTGGRG